MRRLEYVIGHDSLQDEIHDEKHVDHGEMLLRYESSLERTVESILPRQLVLPLYLASLVSVITP